MIKEKRSKVIHSYYRRRMRYAQVQQASESVSNGSSLDRISVISKTQGNEYDNT